MDYDVIITPEEAENYDRERIGKLEEEGKRGEDYLIASIQETKVWPSTKQLKER